MIRFSPTLTVQYPTDYSFFTPDTFDEGLLWAQKNGFDGVEICISHYGGIDVPALRAKLDALGLGCSTLSTGQARTLEDISLLHPDAGAVKRCQERLRQHIDAAAILGSKVTLGLLRGLGHPGGQAAQKKQLAHAMEPVVEYALQKNVTIVVEAINRYETALLNSAEEVAAFIRDDLGSPECIGILWDVFHANIEDPTMESAIRAMGDKLKHVHLADSNRMFPGYGHTDFSSIIRLLNAQGYSEYCSFECLNLPSREICRSSAGPLIQSLRAL